MLYLCVFFPSLWLFAVGVMLIGVCFGTFMGVFPGFCTDRFGQKYNTINYGIMWIGFSAAGLIGPMVLSGVYSATGSYSGAFVTAFAIAAAGLLLGILYRVLAKRENKS